MSAKGDCLLKMKAGGDARSAQIDVWRGYSYREYHPKKELFRISKGELMKKCISIFFVFVFLGCGKSDEELRRIMQEEISKASERTYVTNAQVIGPYSPAVRIGNMLFVSGQIGISQETAELVGNDIDSQTKQALMNLMDILNQAGFDSSDIVQCSVFLKDIKDFPKMNVIYGGFFESKKYPARTTLEVSNLPKNARVEIAAIAFKSK